MEVTRGLMHGLKNQAFGFGLGLGFSRLLHGRFHLMLHIQQFDQFLDRTRPAIQRRWLETPQAPRWRYRHGHFFKTKDKKPAIAFAGRDQCPRATAIATTSYANALFDDPPPSS